MKMIKLIIFILSFFSVVSCQNQGNSLVLEIKRDGYYIRGEKIMDLDIYLGQVENTGTKDLVIIVENNAEASLVAEAVDFSTKAKFKSVSLAAVEPE